MPDASALEDGKSYVPANHVGSGTDAWESPAPTPPYGSALSVFDGTNPTGVWSLFAVDDETSDGGGTMGGWFLTITSTRSSEICIPGGADSEGPAAPYPATTTISGIAGPITDVNLTLTGLSHAWPGNIDVLLVGPGGQNAFVMGDAGENHSLSGVTLTLDDEAAGPLPDAAPLVDGSTYRPVNNTDSLDTDSFDPPAPTPSGGSALSVFDGTNPNGTWSLFVDDDLTEDVGRINSWSLQITDAGFNPTFNLSGGKAKEGKPVTFQVGLSAAPFQNYAIPFTTVPGTAKAGKDFKTAKGSLTFAPGETSKTIVVKTKDDNKDEKNKEKFSLQLTTTTGNVLATAKIKDNDK